MHENAMQPRRILERTVQRIVRIFPFTTRRDKHAFLNRSRAAERQIQKAHTPEETFSVLQRLIASLRNSHTFLSRPQKIYRPRMFSLVKAGDSFLLRRDRKVLGVAKKVNDEPVRTAFVRWRRSYRHCAPRYAEYLAVRSLLLSRSRKPLRLTIRAQEKNMIVKLRMEPSHRQNLPALTLTHLGESIWYLKIITWENGRIVSKDIERMIQKLHDEHPRALLIDVRGNPGGNSRAAYQLASHFLAKPTCFGIVRIRHNGSRLLQRRLIIVRPRRPVLSFPVVVIANTGSFSTTESFIAGLRHTGRSVIVGERTGGGSGNPRRVTLRYGGEQWILSVARWVYYLPNGTPLERIGIRSDIRVLQTAADWRRGVDRGLAVAKRVAQALVEGGDLVPL